MGQYFTPYTKNEKETLFWGQPKEYEEEHNLKGFVGLKLAEHAYFGNKLADAVSAYLYKNPSQIIWVGDYSDMWDKFCENDFELYNFKTVKFQYEGKWLINHSRKLGFLFNTDCEVHPLPLLTSVGNGKGSGDYKGENRQMCGVWADEVLSIEDKLPDGFVRTIQPEFEEWV